MRSQAAVVGPEQGSGTRQRDVVLLVYFKTELYFGALAEEFLRDGLLL